MESMKLFTDEDLMDDQMSAEAAPLSAEEQLQQAEEARERALLERDKAKKDCDTLKNRNTQLMKELRQERALRVAAQQKKSAAMPAAMLIGAAVLALLVILATNSLLVADRLGEPLAFFFIGCCAFFAGMVWERTDVKNKKKGGKSSGNVGLQNA